MKRLWLLGLILLQCMLSYAALVKCPDCKRDVSTTAALCPNCGCPKEAIIKANELKQVEKVSSQAPVAVNSPDYEAVRNSLVLIRTDKGSGSGFVVVIKGKRYVMTNAHVLEGGKTIELRMMGGKVLEWTQMELSKQYDLARLSVTDTVITALQVQEGDITISDKICVFGNSLGEGTFTMLNGKVVSVGPDKFEVDAEFVRGNSGSPVIDAGGKVMGVATYLTYRTAQADWGVTGTRFEGVRRFAIRLAAPMDWVTIAPSEYLRQVNILSDFNVYLVDLFSVITFYGHFYRSHEAELRAISICSDYDYNYEQKHYSDPGWARLFDDYCLARKRYLEMNYWNEQLSAPNSHQRTREHNRYRRIYGNNLDRDVKSALRIFLNLKYIIKKSMSMMKIPTDPLTGKDNGELQWETGSDLTK